MAKLVYQAVYDGEWEEVEVRRPLEAVVYSECGPSRAGRPGLCKWTLGAFVARRTRPCCAESSLHVTRPLGNAETDCRGSSVPVRTPRSVTRTLPLPSPTIPRRLIRDLFLKFRTFGECASRERDGEHSEPSEYSLPR
jgi:hypothetical protein